MDQHMKKKKCANLLGASPGSKLWGEFVRTKGKKLKGR